MPKGVPKAEKLWQREVSFFSIDTDLIQAAGYNFDQGALHQLPKQLPASMRLLVTEVVVEEIINHQMQPVREAISQFTAASDRLKRLAGIALGPIDESFKALSSERVAAERFRSQISDFVARCRGEILPIAGAELADIVFKRYFNNDAPFGKRKDKKSEFPDAMSLLLLQQHAIENDSMGIVASGDAGWSAFAEQSDYLYAVKTIEELAELFAATDEHASELKAKILAAVNDDESLLREQLTDALRCHISNSEWDANELYAGSGRIEAEVYSVELSAYELADGGINVWPVEDEPTTWVVELTALVKVQVHVSANIFVWDSIDREELNLGAESVTSVEDIEIEAYLSCSEVQLEAEPGAWVIEVDIAKGSYSLTGFEVEPDFGDRD